MLLGGQIALACGQRSPPSTRQSTRHSKIAFEVVVACMHGLRNRVSSVRRSKVAAHACGGGPGAVIHRAIVEWRSWDLEPALECEARRAQRSERDCADHLPLGHSDLPKFADREYVLAQNRTGVARLVAWCRCLGRHDRRANTTTAHTSAMEYGRREQLEPAQQQMRCGARQAVAAASGGGTAGKRRLQLCVC